MRWVRLSVLVMTALAPAVGLAVEPDASLVVDIRSEESDGVSAPGPLLVMGRHAYFSASDGVHGSEVWRTDGTEAGTSMVLDACPGSCSGAAGWHMFAGGSGFFFFGGGGFTSPWYSDGTAAGTIPVSDDTTALRRYGAATSSGLFFYENSTELGTELWVAGTSLSAPQVIDIYPGECSSHPIGMTAIGDRVLFTAYNEAGDRSVWVSDGSEGGTRQLAVTGALRLQSWLSPFVELGGVLYFTERDDPEAGIWCTDGSVAGTHRIIDLCTGNCSEGPDIRRVGDALFLVQYRSDGVRLLVSDGIASGGAMPGAELLAVYPARSYLSGFADLGGRVLFSRHSDDQVELWISDVTTAETRLVRDGFTSIIGMTALEDAVVFRGEQQGTGPALWRSDGSAEGTVLLRDDVEPVEPFYSQSYQRLGDLVLLEVATNGGRGELWRTDGTADGTEQVADIHPPRSSSDPQQLCAAGDRVFFLATDNDGRRGLFASDGSAAGTIRADAPAYTWELTPLGSQIVFTGANDGEAMPIPGGVGLWSWDGVQVAVQLCSDCRMPEALTGVGDSVYFGAGAPTMGRTVWRTEGTSGTSILLGTADLNWGTGSPWGLDCRYFPRHFQELAGVVYFLGSTETEGVALWRHGEDQLELVAPLPFGPCDMTEVARLDGLLYLSNGHMLWRSDGSAAGTREMVSFADGEIRDLSPVAGSLLLVQKVDYRRDRLLKVTGDRVEVVSELRIDGHTSTVTEVAAGDRLLFLSVSTDPVGHELWVSDGTPDGTRLLKDIFPGVHGSRPMGLTVIGDIVLFAADDGISGHELWRSDGSVAGTTLVDEVSPGRSAANPSEPTRAGALLYFAADDGSGRELWSYPFDAAAGYHPPPRRVGVRRR